MGVILPLNMVPEDGETGVPIEELVRLHVVSVDVGVVLDPTVQIYLTRSSDATRRLAYDQNAGGFQAPYNGTFSAATYQMSPGSAVLDELWLTIDFTDYYTSLEWVLVEVIATSGGATSSLYYSYSWQIEDLTAPVIEEVFWLKPWKCRVKFDEALNTAATPGGSLFVQADLGGAEVVGTNQGDDATQIRLASLTPTTGWIGKWAQVAGSAYPQNNRPRPITAIDASAKTVTVNTADAYGGPMKADDGRDFDEQNILVRQRTIKATISPYFFTARADDEGASEDAGSAERTQCAYCPMPISASLPTAAELPAGENPNQYVYLELEDDVSYGRLYTLHVDGVEDVYDNVTSDATHDFQTPSFGIDSDRFKIWMNGLMPGLTRRDDLDHDRALRKLVVVLEDVFNMLWYRIDQLQYLHDPSRCPDEWVDFLLYDLANPFRFPLDTDSKKRLLASALPGFYKGIGVAQEIIDFLYLLLGITFEITVFVSGDWWALGTGVLGTTTILGPGTEWARNAYEIVSPVTLTDEQRRIVEEVATWADPFNMHLIRIVEPGTTPALPSYWIIGTSALDYTTILSP